MLHDGRRLGIILFMLAGALLAAPETRAQVPTPEAVFGFAPGADYKLASYDQQLDYYDRLDAASDRVQVTQIGTSVMGRPMLLLFISSADNIAQLDRWKDISTRLARARAAEDEALQLAEEGKAIIWIDGGMHATEMAHGQMTPELAYRVATEESAEMQKIRDNVVLLLMPMMNPDGLDIVKSWYDRNLGTPYETSGPPWLYQKYVGHDNNRDYFMNNMPETKAVSQVLYNEWYPQIVLNHHQTSPDWARIFVPPFSDPVNPHIHPGVTAGVNQVGAAMTQRFAVQDMPGVVSNNRYTMFWNGGGRTTPYYHNQIGILTEVGHATPTPRYYEPDSLPAFIGARKSTDGTTITYPDPWRGGESHFRDAVDYLLTASMAVLDLAADRRQQLLHNIYAMGRDAIEAGEAGGPYAYVIPPEQWDDGEAHNLVNILRQGGVEVHRATASFTAGGAPYPAGSFVVPASQAFRPYVMDLLEPQDYPTRYAYPGGPPDPPYDLAGWTLPMQMGVTVDRIDSAFEAPMEAVTADVAPPAGDVTSNADFGWALSHRPNASAQAVNELLAEGAAVHWTAAPITAEGTEHPAGTILIEADGVDEDRIEALAAAHGLDFVGLPSAPAAETHRLQAPRVGLYKSWDASMDEGWTRWLFENYAVPHDTLHDA
ncbi:MAG: peptidase M14, partial [Bacteroidetes bacterium]|nr:peptidase M14 [Bacteroidota bacterium]